MYSLDTMPVPQPVDAHATTVEFDAVSKRIARLESDLGIRSAEDAILEATLLIDARFMQTAGILSMGEKVKLFFGDLEWANHLEARKYAREYGDQPLSPEFVINLHQIHLRGGPYEGQPSIGTSKDPRGSAFVNGRHVPFRCSDSEIAALNANPRVTWSATPDNPHLGIVRYNVKTKEDRYADLQAICDWYNAQPPDTEWGYGRAAGVQHKIVSWHGLGYDYNGRVSRDVLNWSTENDHGLACAAIDFDADLFSTEQEWENEIAFGVMRYALSKGRKNAGFTGTDIIPGVLERRPYYEQFLAGTIEIPTFQGGGEWQDHEPFERFAAQVELESLVGQWSEGEGPLLEDMDAYYERYEKRIARYRIDQDVDPL